MPAKPVTLFCRAAAWALVLLLGAGALSSGGLPAAAKAPLPVVLLYPATPGDITALVDLRTRLRLDGHVDVLTYDPESAAIKRAAAEASHPEWLLTAPPKDDDRLVLARALGVAFYAVVSPGRTSDDTHVELVETALSARTFDWSGTNRQFGVRAIESQVADSLAHPLVVDAANTPPTPILPSLAPPASIATTAPPASIVIKLPSSLTVPLVKPTVKPPVVLAAPIIVPTIKIPPKPLTLPQTQIAQVPPVRLSPPVLTVPVPQLPQSPKPGPLILEPLHPTEPLHPANTGGTKRIGETGREKIGRGNPAPTGLPLTPPALGAGIRPQIPVQAAMPVIVPKAPPRMTLPTTGTQMAMLPRPKPYVPEPDTPVTMPTRTPVAAVGRKTRPEDLAAISPLMARGDSAFDGGDFIGAISYFRQAVNGAPLSVVPRLKLAQAYQKEGLSDKALDEARRALEISPDSAPVQQLLTDLDQQNGTSDGTLIRYRAMIERNPADPTAHAALADALWNNSDLDGAETEYKAAKALSPAGDHAADAQLARLYATEARYDDALGALQNAGSGGYALAIKIVKNRAETLSSTLDASRDAFAGGKSTREQFYDDAKKLSAQAQGLAGFVAKVTPPTRYRLSHLHRMLSTNLLAQESAMLVAFIETGDARQSDSVAALEKSAATEMLTAQATEEKLGLWNGKKQP